MRKDIQRVLDSDDPLKTWVEVSELYMNRYYKLEKKSVRNYKRFSEVYSAGDEVLASSKLHDAGTNLYMCYEWA